MWLANGVIDAKLRARGFGGSQNRPWVASVSESSGAQTIAKAQRSNKGRRRSFTAAYGASVHRWIFDEAEGNFATIWEARMDVDIMA